MRIAAFAALLAVAHGTAGPVQAGDREHVGRSGTGNGNAATNGMHGNRGGHPSDYSDPAAAAKGLQALINMVIGEQALREAIQAHGSDGSISGVARGGGTGIDSRTGRAIGGV